MAYADPARAGLNHSSPLASTQQKPEDWTQLKLNNKEQLIAFEAAECGYCRKFDKEVLAGWKHPIPIAATNSSTPPPGWKLDQSLFATPTVVLFRNKQEISRYTGYQGAEKFWQWLELTK